MEIKRPTRHEFGRIGVLMGGPSAEREISLKSGRAVVAALQAQGIEVVGIDITTDSQKENSALLSAQGMECAFIALHGRFGEDGQVQGILETLRIPYTGSGVKASSLALNKPAACAIFAAGGIPVPRSRVCRKNQPCDLEVLVKELGAVLVVKPATGGSSIGLSIAEGVQQVAKAMELAFTYEETAMVEEYIPGRELTVGILDQAALPVVEIIPKRKFFDYEAKYKAGMTQYVVPAKLDPSLSAKIQEMGLAAHRLLGCSGFSRADFILSTEGIPFILEVNTIPGFTETSLMPKAARCAGLEFPQLCLRLIELAYEKTHLESAPTGK